MSNTIRAVFEGGVFRPVEPVGIPDHILVEFEPRVVGIAEGPHEPGPTTEESLDRVYQVLGRRFRSGRGDLAERHNEHQP
jgi:predicted DNA-binding antitoxin AbrB/MazE fold protein